MFIIKRNGSQEEFDQNKIVNAITAANKEVSPKNQLSEEEINEIANNIKELIYNSIHTLNVEEIQDMVEDHIYDLKKFVLGRAYSQYRFKHTENRNTDNLSKQIKTLIDFNNEEVMQENSNKNPMIASVQRDYMAGEISKHLTERELLPPDIWKAHTEGIIHFHDTDYFANHIHNCCLINLEDMLQNGTVISDTMIEKPKSFITACNIATQVIAQVASSQYGGQSITLSHLAPFVEVSRQKIKSKLLEDFNVSSEDELSEEYKKLFNTQLNHRLNDEIVSGIQLIQYQILTLLTTNGQTPFVTIFMYIDEVEDGQTREDLVTIIKEVIRQRTLGVKNEKGVYITPAFPKLIYVLDEDNITPDSKYYDVTRMAAECTAKRLVPDYISAKVMKELKDGHVYTCMGCRSFLTSEPHILKDDNSGKRKFYGRFNQGVVTINLPDVALSSEKDLDRFWKIFEDRLELCHRALRKRHERLLGTPSDIAPIIWQHGGLARLKKGEKIDKLLYDGYSTLSLGYAGLYECVYYMTGKSHTDEEGFEFAVKVMEKMNEKTKEWRAAENIGYSLYGTPLESTTYKFAKSLRKRFGVIENVTDHNYITNSYHVCVREKINAFDKLSLESKFQILSPGGAISYVETPDLHKNIDAILQVMTHIYDNILYAELNTKSDYCQVCGYDGEIKIIDDTDTGKLIWECPNCKNRDQSKMNVARRTCGYIGSNFWNQGRTQEINDRVLHIDNNAVEE